MCTDGFCPIGDTGTSFTISGAQMPQGGVASPTGGGLLCISGHVSQVPDGGAVTVYNEGEWGCGLGVYLDQPDGGEPVPYQLTGTGVTVNVINLPDCTSARVMLTNQEGGTTGYCATLTPGVEMPWSAFVSPCGADPGVEPTALTGAPSVKALEILFIPNDTESCTFTDFCITQVIL